MGGALSKEEHFSPHAGPHFSLPATSAGQADIGAGAPSGLRAFQLALPNQELLSSEEGYVVHVSRKGAQRSRGEEEGLSLAAGMAQAQVWWCPQERAREQQPTFTPVLSCSTPLNQKSLLHGLH